VSQEVNNKLLSRFLMSRRASLSPADFSLPQSGRRRARGLRREEVAALAGMSVSWYTWLEQGRDIRVSEEVLERLCEVLQLDADQREYLFTLAHRRPAPPLLQTEAAKSYKASPLLWRSLEALTVPAFALTYRWDVIAWNEVMRLFRDYSKLRPGARNILRMLVEDPMHRLDPRDYEKKVRLATSRLRSDYSTFSNDPVLDALIEELSGKCPIFKRHWLESSRVGQAHGTNTLYHPEFGVLRFQHSVYVPKGEPHVRVVVFLPGDRECAESLAALARRCVSELAAGEALRTD
jgi:transcriptional regulator with XRE-family HTH domain